MNYSRFKALLEHAAETRFELEALDAAMIRAGVLCREQEIIQVAVDHARAVHCKLTELGDYVLHSEISSRRNGA